MSQEQQKQTAFQELDLSVDSQAESQTTESVQMVPVSEAIKYRKRAQAAEQQVAELSEQVEQHQQTSLRAQNRLAQSELDNTLTRELVQAGAVDVEVALHLLRGQLDTGQDEPNTKEVIQRMQQERPYLFGGWEVGSVGDGTISRARPTAHVRTPQKGSTVSLARTAQQAQRSGSRKDMQEYLRMRRSVRG